jgi:hypothetical protein
MKPTRKIEKQSIIPKPPIDYNKSKPVPGKHKPNFKKASEL